MKTSNPGITAIKDCLESGINKWRSMLKHFDGGMLKS